jgi:ADP-ribose pyrophosphatase YjhB (NUDIX family)
MENKWILYAKRIQAIAQAGLTYAQNDYDVERFQELRDISVAMMADISGEKIPRIQQLFANETGYQTPKVDIRGVIFKDRKILMVRERIDGCWSLPGGWADIGFSPKEVVIKEVREEAGLKVKPVKLLSVWDKKLHPHPHSPYYTYKFFILCEIVSGTIAVGMETLDVGFFGRSEIPPLSVERNTASQIETMFDYLDNPEKEVMLD